MGIRRSKNRRERITKEENRRSRKIRIDRRTKSRMTNSSLPDSLKDSKALISSRIKEEVLKSQST